MRGEYIKYSASPILSKSLFRCMGRGKGRLGLALRKSWCLCICEVFFKKGKARKRVFLYMGFGPGGETSIPPVPVP